MRGRGQERFVWVLLALASVLGADRGALAIDDPRPGSQASPGAVAEFKLEDLEGHKLTREHFRGHQAVVLFFLGTECPVSNGYAPEMTALAGRYAKQGVLVEGVHSDPSVTREVAREHAKEYSLKFPILLDPEQSLARQAGITITPEVVVLSSEGKILYRGRIDNRYSTDGKRRLEATRHELEEALGAVLAGRQPAAASTKAFGCPLPKRRMPAAK